MILRGQATAAAYEVVSVVSPADPPQRAYLPALQGQEPLAQPQETQEEIVAKTERHTPISLFIVIIVHCKDSRHHFTVNNSRRLRVPEVRCQCPTWQQLSGEMGCRSERLTLR